jgi:hypothetical protein
MNRDAFEAEVVALANGGGRVTVANVSAKTGLSLRTCQTLLDMMMRDGALDRDDDGEAAVYRVRGLDRAGHAGARTERTERPEPKRESEPPAQKVRVKLDEATRGVQDEVIAAAGKIVVKQAGERIQAAMGAAGIDVKAKRNLGIAALAGLLLGPLGLFYAAPWINAILASAVYLLLGWLPFLRIDGMWKFWVVVHLLSAFASFLYAVRFNRVGERAPLLPGLGKKKAKGGKKAPPSDDDEV